MNDFGPSAAAFSSSPTREERNWALVAHLGGPAGLLLSAGLFGFAVPLVVWLLKREESEFVAQQAREALNFQLTLFLLYALGWLFVLFTLGVGILIVWPAFVMLWVLELILGIRAALRSNDGKAYRYPCSLRFIG